MEFHNLTWEFGFTEEQDFKNAIWFFSFAKQGQAVLHHQSEPSSFEKNKPMVFAF